MTSSNPSQTPDDSGNSKASGSQAVLMCVSESCKASLPSDSRFCELCGVALGPASLQVLEDAKPLPEPNYDEAESAPVPGSGKTVRSASPAVATLQEGRQDAGAKPSGRAGKGPETALDEFARMQRVLEQELSALAGQPARGAAPEYRGEEAQRAPLDPSVLSLRFQDGRIIECRPADVLGRSEGPGQRELSVSILVSPRHGQLSNEFGKWFYQDLWSENGSALNGRAVLPGKRVELCRGDVLLLANLKLEVL